MMDDIFLERAAVATFSLERKIAPEDARKAWADLAPALKEKRRDNLRLVGKYLAACGVASFLGSCATPSEPTVKTVEVKIPVVQPCHVETPPVPALPDTTDALLSAPDIFAQTQLLLAGRALRIPYEAALAGALAVCTAP